MCDIHCPNPRPAAMSCSWCHPAALGGSHIRIVEVVHHGRSIHRRKDGIVGRSTATDVTHCERPPKRDPHCRHRHGSAPAVWHAPSTWRSTTCAASPGRGRLATLVERQPDSSKQTVSLVLVHESEIVEMFYRGPMTHSQAGS